MSGAHLPTYMAMKTSVFVSGYIRPNSTYQARESSCIYLYSTLRLGVTFGTRFMQRELREVLEVIFMVPGLILKLNRG